MSLAKQIARDKVAYALRRHLLIKPVACELCGKDRRLQAHHERYDRPLDVLWVCTPCHAIIDGRKRRGRKYQKRKVF